MKEQMKKEQLGFLLELYVRNFLEQIEVDTNGFTFDELTSMVMEDSELCPRFSCYLLSQTHSLIYTKGLAEYTKESFLQINN